MKTFRSFVSFSALFFLFAGGGSCEQVYSKTVGPCEGTLELDVEWKAIAIRFHQQQMGLCEISKNDLSVFLNDAFENFSSVERETTFKSLFAGRVVEYPWISRLLAEKASKHPDWSAGRGKALKGNANTFVGAVLHTDEVVSVFQTPLNKAGYRVTGVSVEKVLVSSEKSPHAPEWTKNKGKVPYDALMWLTIEPVAPTDK